MSCDCDYICGRNDVDEHHYSNCNTKKMRSSDGRVSLKNKHLDRLDKDILYHLGFDTSMDLQKMFGDIKFVCMGGTSHRMYEFANHIAKELGCEVGDDLAAGAKRYAVYKVGPVLAVSHGVGIPSMTVALQEVIKLMFYAKAKDPFFIRMGSCGGVGVPGGTVVVSTNAINGELKAAFEIPVLGKIKSIPAILDKRLAEELIFLSKGIAKATENYQTVEGVTMGADDFYRGQARLDGPFCDYTEEDKMAFLRKLSELGVRNIEMEAPAFAALTAEAGVRAAIVCIALLNRLEGDQVVPDKKTLLKWEERPMMLIKKLITKYMTAHLY